MHLYQIQLQLLVIAMFHLYIYRILVNVKRHASADNNPQESNHSDCLTLLLIETKW